MYKQTLSLILLVAFALIGCVAPMPIEDTTPTNDAPTAANKEPEIAQEPTESDTAPEAPEQAPTPAPVVEEQTESTASDEPTDWTNIATLEGDLYIRGNPTAPIRLVDYSDFL